MSAFLGPIHVKMYDRILYQDLLTQAMLQLAEEHFWIGGLRQVADDIAPAASLAPLEDIIDPVNIHGWLSDKVSTCEQRLALTVCKILAGHPDRLGELEKLMNRMGRQCTLAVQGNAEQAFQAIHDRLLDGMPCDFPFNVTESCPDLVAWQVVHCPHAPHWQAENGDADTYYRLRDAWVEGALEGSGICHTRANGAHTLRKER